MRSKIFAPTAADGGVRAHATRSPRSRRDRQRNARVSGSPNACSRALADLLLLVRATAARRSGPGWLAVRPPAVEGCLASAAGRLAHLFAQPLEKDIKPVVRRNALEQPPAISMERSRASSIRASPWRRGRARSLPPRRRGAWRPPRRRLLQQPDPFGLRVRLALRRSSRSRSAAQLPLAPVSASARACSACSRLAAASASSLSAASCRWATIVAHRPEEEAGTRSR